MMDSLQYIVADNYQMSNFAYRTWLKNQIARLRESVKYCKNNEKKIMRLSISHKKTWWIHLQLNLRNNYFIFFKS